MDSTIARLFTRAARKALRRDAPAPKPRKSRREETGGGLRKLTRAFGRRMNKATLIDVSEAFYQSNPYDTLDPCWQSIISGGEIDEGWSGDYMTGPDCPSLGL